MARKLPWGLVIIGAFIAVVMQLAGVPALAFAVGVYLPLSTTMPIFVGGLVRAGWSIGCRRSPGRGVGLQPGVLLSSGYIAGRDDRGHPRSRFLAFAPGAVGELLGRLAVPPRRRTTSSPLAGARRLRRPGADPAALVGTGVLLARPRAEGRRGRHRRRAKTGSVSHAGLGRIIFPIGDPSMSSRRWLAALAATGRPDLRRYRARRRRDVGLQQPAAQAAQGEVRLRADARSGSSTCSSSAVRFNSGGSGSFVSADGLVMTNHHVGADTLQKISTEEKDYYKDGFLRQDAGRGGQGPRPRAERPGRRSRT